MIRNKMKWSIAVVFFTANVYAQEFTFQTEVKASQDNGYCSIVLSPELLARSSPGLSDLRLFDSDGKEKPYLLRQEEAMSATSLFRSYNIIEKTYKRNAISHLIFSNPDRKAISNISFRVKNTDVQKRARLSGSDDKENWYVIKNNYLLHSMQSEEETTELKILNFPLSDYLFFKLEINDNWKLPINILSVGYYETQKEMGQTTNFDYEVIEQKDSLKTSFVRLGLPETKYVEKLRLEVSGAEYYSRYTKVKVRRTGVNRKKQTVTYLETVGSFDLNSNSTNVIDLGGVTADTLFIEIENKDNPPLQIEKAEGSFLNKYLVAQLDSAGIYDLRMGDATLRSPEYDIVQFADQIPNDIPKIAHGKILDLRPADTTSAEKRLLNNPYLIWFVIGGVGLVLAFISVRMIKEIGNKA